MANTLLSRPSALALGRQDGSETGGFAASRPTRSPRSYEELRERVRETLEGGRLRAQKILQKIQTEMFWRTGRWIHLYLKHEKKTRGRAPYGEKVVSKLASDLKYDKDTLYDALKVYRNYPIFGTYRKLSFSHHRVLLLVKDEARRKALAREAEKNDWSSHELLRRIRGSRSLPDGPKSTPVLTPRKGKLHHYRIVERGDRPVPAQSGLSKLGRNGRLFVDLGFRDFRELTELSAKAAPAPVRWDGKAATKLEAPRPAARTFKDGDIVEGTSLDKLAKRPHATQSDLYTYRAEILQLPDADTFWLFIDKGFASYREDKIRLRGIDCPEISTPEGRRAKEFVEDLLRDDSSPPKYAADPSGRTRRSFVAGPSGQLGQAATRGLIGQARAIRSGYLPVLITTTKTPDKWDRYLVDCYLEKDGQEIYLNRLLLEKNIAVPYVEG